MRWYRLAAEQGHGSALANVGTNYFYGDGEPQNYIQAHMWLNLAASGATGETREAVANRDRAASLLTSAALNEAQRLAREWEGRRAPA